jgi:hypothetical protein
MAKMTREDAFRAGFENPLMGDIGPLQRIYGTVQALGEELGGADMGTPLGQRFAQRQRATKAEVKRLQKLREQFPEEFGRGMMMAQEQQDPYMLGLGLGTTGAMRPGVSTFSPVQQSAGTFSEELPIRELPAAASRQLSYSPAPEAPYYRTVPPEMGTSMRPMTPFQQNQVGLSTGRFGMEGYAPEMAGTDFESYGPMSRTGGAREFAGRATGFDRNMYEAWKQGQFNRMRGRPEPMGGDFTLEDLGQAVAPYRQGGLVYEPVGQGSALGQIAGPQGAPRLGYERGPIEGEWSDVLGISGPRAQNPRGWESVPGGTYVGGMDFGVTRDGMAAAPSGMPFDPRVAAGAAGLGYLFGLPNEQRVNTSAAQQAAGRQILPPVGIFSRQGATALSGQTPGAGNAFVAPAETQSRPARATGSKKAPPPQKGKTTEKSAKSQQAQGEFEPNFNYLVTRAIDQLLGQNEAERGREYQQYYATHPWPY